MSDLIDRQAAIDELRDWEMCYDWDEHCREEPKAPWVVSPSGVINKLPSAQPDTYWKEQCQSYEQTINKLRESLSTQPEIKQQAINSSDCIDRRAALDALRVMQTYKLFAGDDMLLIDQAGAQTELMLLQSARPEPKRGKWIRNGWAITCSECGYDMPYTVRNFCPNCGAKMEGVSNES